MLTAAKGNPPLARGDAARKPGFLESYPDLLNVGHMREITGLSAQTIRAECASGTLPAVRIGRRWFIPKCRFAEYVGGAYER